MELLCKHSGFACGVQVVCGLSQRQDIVSDEGKLSCELWFSGVCGVSRSSSDAKEVWGSRWMVSGGRITKIGPVDVNLLPYAYAANRGRVS